jgi:small subunit ribosomal protein S3
MAQKTNPKVLRIKGIEDWNSRGFYEKNFADLLEEDFKIREFLNKKIGKAGVERIVIERFPGEINVIIFTARPGLIIGRKGEGVEKLVQELKKEVVGEKKGLKMEIREAGGRNS